MQVEKTVLQIDLQGYSTVARALEGQLNSKAVAELDAQVQGLIDEGLAAAGVTDDVRISNSGDGALLVFDSASVAHDVAVAIHFASRRHNDKKLNPETQRWFRIGLATGELTHMGPKTWSGYTISTAVRLEAAGIIGEIVIDTPTYKSLTAEKQSAYGSVEKIPGKREEMFDAHRFAVVTMEDNVPAAPISVAVVADIVNPSSSSDMGLSRGGLCQEQDAEFCHFDTTLPAIGRSEIEANQKFDLYGGGANDYSLDFRAMKHVFAGYAFDRSTVYELANRLREPSVGVRSYTLRSLNGAGLSIALAQLIRELATDEWRKVLWVIDNPDATRKLLSSLSKDAAKKICSSIQQDSSSTRQLVIIVDDVHLVSRSGMKKLFEFRDGCIDYCKSSPGLQIALVFGSFGTAPTYHEHDLFELKLSPEDMKQCYEKMANTPPRILSDTGGGLHSILLKDPSECRGLKDDAQAFIDFLLEHGNPTNTAKNHWLARTDGLDEQSLSMFTMIAASQLIDVPLEQWVAKQLFAQYFVEPLERVRQVTERVPGLAEVQEPWPGLVLSCARRAQSILKRTGKFSVVYLNDAYSSLVQVALERFRCGGQAADASLEFAQHIFQRLSKDELFPFEDKPLIARQLLTVHLDSITAIYPRFNLSQMASWAGTLSPYLGVGRGGKLLSERHLAKAIGLTCALCEGAMNDLQSNGSQLSPKIANTIFRACKRLASLGARLARSSPDDIHAIRIQKLCKQLHEALTPDRIRALLEQGLSNKSDDAAHRCNELVHSQASFLDAYRGSATRHNYDAMTKWYDFVEKLFVDAGIEMDAANWLMRAEYVWIDKRADARTRQLALDMRAHCLQQANGCVLRDPYNQGTWHGKKTTAITNFTKHYPDYGILFD